MTLKTDRGKMTGSCTLSSNVPPSALKYTDKAKQTGLKKDNDG